MLINLKSCRLDDRGRWEHDNRAQSPKPVAHLLIISLDIQAIPPVIPGEWVFFGTLKKSLT